VGTALSQKNARAARAGDPVFGYSAGEGYRELAALAQVVEGSLFVAGQGPRAARSVVPGGFTVALRPVALLDQPVPLAAVRRALAGTQPEFFRTRFGSIFKVRPPEYARVMRAVRAANPGIEVPGAWARRCRGRKDGTG
jgi:hypothetical protein